MSDLQKGYSFSGTSPNNNVTAEKLNTLVDGATILTGFYTGKGENTSAADDDYLLLYEASSGTYRKIQKRNLVTQGKAETGFRNLVITNSGSAPTTKIDVSADEVVMRSSDGNVYHATGLMATLDVTVYSGTATPNGRDFTPLMPFTFYGVWAISDGINDRTLLSVAQTPGASPTLPAGFLYSAMLGVVRTGTAGALGKFVQRGCEVALSSSCAANDSATDLNPTVAGVEFGSSSGGLQIHPTARTFVEVDLSKCVPVAAACARGTLGITVSSTVLPHCTYAVAAKGTGEINAALTEAIGMKLFTIVAQPGDTYGFFGSGQFEVDLLTPQTMWVAAADIGARHAMRINGYKLNL